MSEPARVTDEQQALALELEAAELEAAALAEVDAEARAPDDETRAAGPEAAGGGDAATDAAADGAAGDLSLAREELTRRKDVAGLLRRATASRTGQGLARDIAESFACYEAAATLGSAEGLYAQALFCLAGVVVPEDVAAGMGHLRSAAGAGSQRAKLYLANLYELGLGRDPDPDKADVWYRGAARALGLAYDPEDPAFVKAMAECGAIRHARLLLRDESVPKKDRVAYLARAKALGYGLYQRRKLRETAEAGAVAREIEDAMRPSITAPTGACAARTDPASATGTEGQPTEKKAERAKPARARKGPPFAERVTALVTALFIVGAGAGAGMLATLAARRLLDNGGTVPIVGTHVGYILPAAVLASLVPTLLVYPVPMLVVAAAVGALAYGAGWGLWPSPAGQLMADRLHQAQAFGLCALGLCLLVIALLGGTRRRRFES